MTELSLTDLIDIEVLKKIQDEFSKYTGMAALMTNEEGIPLTEGSAFTDFCANYVRKSELGCQRCILSNKKAALRTLKANKPFVYMCHAGLVDFASPIMLGDRLVGYFMGGQVRFSSETDEAALKETAKELGIPYEKYYRAMQKTKVVCRKEMRKTAHFIGIVTNVLSAMAYQNYTATEKYRSLERAARSQSNFLIELSSELNKNMREWISALEDGVKNKNVEAVMEVVDTMLTNSTTNTACSIIGDIVDYMKFSNGDIALYESTYSFYDMIQEVVELEAEDAAEKRIRIICQIDESVPRTLFGDGGRIAQMLNKLIVNAIHSKADCAEETELYISASVQKSSYAHLLKIQLWDKGRKLSETDFSELAAFFSDGFVRLREHDEVNERSLLLVDLFVRQMQGTVLVESKGEEGMAFLIELPQLEVTEN